MAKMKYAPEVIDFWFVSLEAPVRALTKREENFIISIRGQWARNRVLSEDQLKELETIYVEKTA